MGVFEGFCLVTLNVLHFSAWVKRGLAMTALWIWSAAVYVLHHKGTKLEHIQRDIVSLKKVPSHLAFIIQHEKEKLEINELSKMAVWAFASGVQTVSLYHTTGRAGPLGGVVSCVAPPICLRVCVLCTDCVCPFPNRHTEGPDGAPAEANSSGPPAHVQSVCSRRSGIVWCTAASRGSQLQLL